MNDDFKGIISIYKLNSIIVFYSKIFYQPTLFVKELNIECDNGIKKRETGKGVYFNLFPVKFL